MRWRTPARTARPPGFVEPCVPTLAHAVPDGPRWVHEIKHDGYRFICWRRGDRVRLFTRRGHDWTERMPRVIEAPRSLSVQSVTIDGEAVMCDAAGLPARRTVTGRLRPGSPHAA